MFLSFVLHHALPAIRDSAAGTVSCFTRSVVVESNMSHTTRRNVSSVGQRIYSIIYNIVPTRLSLDIKHQRNKTQEDAIMEP